MFVFYFKDHKIRRLIPKIEFDFGLYKISLKFWGVLSIVCITYVSFSCSVWFEPGTKRPFWRPMEQPLLKREWENIELCPSNPVKVGHCTSSLWPRVRRALNISQGKWAIDPQSQKNSNGFFKWNNHYLKNLTKNILSSSHWSNALIF